MIDFSQLNEFYVGGNEVQTLYINGSKVWEKQTVYAGLAFTAKQANSTIQLVAVGTPNSISLEYSTDNGQTFSTYTVGNTITLTNVDDKVLFRAGANGNSSFGKSQKDYYKFVMSGTIACNGNIHYLLNQSGTEPQGGLPPNCFRRLFNNCTSLTTPPTLPATTLATSCYHYMFFGCTSLTTTPVLPATTLAYYCYAYMFYGCTSLTVAPELPATTLASNCYYYMFQGCTSLNTIKLHYTGAFSSTYFTDWVSGVQTTSGTFYYNGSDTTRGASAIPSNWTITTFST